MSIASIKAGIPDASTATKEKLDHAMVVAGLLINTIKRITLNIGPYVLDDLGLDETIHWYCNEFSILYNLPCHYSGSFNEAQLTQEMKIDFFRICQESLNNIIHHAEASLVKVVIREKGNSICMTITDNGKGFVLKDQKKTYGLTIMQELAASIDATLTIKSKTGKGTTVTIAVAKQN
jgi:signal transduction histidine kinase